MLSAIRLQCSQITANYRKPTAIDIQESYKLPPYSTVIGLIHNMCGFDKYHPMKISIQGNYNGSFTDMYTRYFFGIAYDETRHQAFTTREDGGKDGITRGLGYTEVVSDINLIIHIVCENSEDQELVLNGLKAPLIYPSLGRFEDLLRIDSISQVELVATNKVDIINDTYVPLETYNRTIQGEDHSYLGTILNLNKNYELKSNFRYFTKVKVKQLKSGIYLSSNQEILMKEKDDNIGVFLA